MGRHSDSSSLNTTLTELGALAARSLTADRSAGHGRRRAEGPARTSVAPVMARAGGVATALSIAVSGSAWAAVNAHEDAADDSASPALAALGSTVSDEASTQDSSVGDSSGDASGAVTTTGAETVSTLTEDVADPHASSEKESASLAAGEKKVETAGVDGVTRVTYRVVSVDGQEVSREVLSSVAVTKRVDEVVVVGKGTPQDVAIAQAGDGKTKASAQAIGKALLSSYGWGEDQYSCLDSLWTRESQWDYQAVNPSSGAYGIPQSLPGEKMGSVSSDWASNPTTQIKWGLGYIKERYGNPCAAWAHSEATNWY
ncbi:G5 domain-containing protein [Actinomyces denticolens]|uniref:G5 domain-containing protein n=1 Tax=Actinomyces denticolens TaxID=52767 RepID=A0ABY1IGU7_9ACTO|nr:G5 domain-containing protein [Actinomyces denticolens]SHJ15755.1 G5 domain-containing protein [Actinomyces denticolens]